MRGVLEGNQFVFRLLVVIVGAAFLSIAATAGVVGSGTPSSCTEAALQAQVSLGGTITFNCGSGPQTIPFANTMFIGSTNPKVTIDGNSTITLDGTGNNSGMVGIFGSQTEVPDVTFKRITIANGNITSGLIAGGAIQNFGKLTLDTVVLRGNHAIGSGAIFQEPCTGCLDPSLIVTNCLFQNNSTGGGGAISMQGGNASIADSTFTGNAAPGAGAIEIYGNSTFKINMTIDRCTFTANTANSYAGGAITVESLNPGSSVSLTNDTFTGNSAIGANGRGAAVYIDAAPVSITNCTIARNNAASSGGAIYFGSRAPATKVNNSIVASNSGGNCSLEPGGNFSGGHNIQYGDSTCFLMTVANPLLGLLADNGGPTQTIEVKAGSPAIDAADTAAAPSTDQRGIVRTDGNGDGVVAADIGSFEAPAVTAGNTNLLVRRHHAVHP